MKESWNKLHIIVRHRIAVTPVVLVWNSQVLQQMRIMRIMEEGFLIKKKKDLLCCVRNKLTETKHSFLCFKDKKLKYIS